MKKFVFCCLFLAGSSLQSSGEKSLCEPEPCPARLIQTIVLLGENEPLLNEEEICELTGEVVVVGLALPGSASDLKERLEPFWQEDPTSRETLLALKVTVARFYEDSKDPFILALVPRQDLFFRVVQMRIIHAKVGEIQVEGMSDPSRLMQQLRLVPEDPLLPRRIEQDLEWLNRYPARRVDLLYQAGKKPATTNLIFVVEEKSPNSIYAGVDNTGVETIGRERYFAGLNLGGWLGFYQLFSCQYTASNDFHKFQSVTAQYLAYLPWRNILNLYGGYSEVHATLPFPEIQNHGKSGSGSIRYTVPLPPSKNFSHEVVVGGDFKSTDNTIEFSQLFENYGNIVFLTQLAVSYGWKWQSSPHQLDFQGSVFASPGSWLPHQTKADYNSLRPGAVNHWIYMRGSAKYLYRSSCKFSWLTHVCFQASSSNLIPSEQAGIGGYDTVRGYDEQQLNMDNAFIANLELRSPPIPIIAYIRQTKVKDSLQFLGFVDYGVGWNRSLIPGEGVQQYLAGTGPGFRYTLDPWLTARLDWGIKLHKKASFTGGNTKIHFSVVASY